MPQIYQKASNGACISIVLFKLQSGDSVCSKIQLCHTNGWPFSSLQNIPLAYVLSHSLAG